jgi:hypothetical protein
MKIVCANLKWHKEKHVGQRNCMEFCVTTPEPTKATNHIIISKHAIYLSTWDSALRFKFWVLFFTILSTQHVCLLCLILKTDS